MRCPGGHRLLMLSAVAAMLPWAWPGRLPSWLAWSVWLAWLAVIAARPLRFYALLALPLCLTLLFIESRYQGQLPAELDGKDFIVQGIVQGLPAQRADMMEFLFRVDHPESRAKGVPKWLQVRWYQAGQTVRAGEKWSLLLGLKPPRNRINFVGPDPEKRYFAMGVGALATVKRDQAVRLAPAGSLSINGWRESMRTKLLNILSEEPALPQILALSLADRSRMPAPVTETFRQTGTGHLLAISGLHIGFAALLGYRLGSGVGWVLGGRVRTRSGLWSQWVCALILAGSYAALAGLGVSTFRALVMLMVASAAVLLRNHFHPVAGWALALFLVLLFDPSAPLTPGFWMSFGAVFVLIASFSPLTGPAGALSTLARAQLCVFLAMLPLGMYWFQFASVLGLVANLFAIPAVSLVIVPLVLSGAGLLMAGFDSLAAGLLLPAAWVTDGLTTGLSWLALQGTHAYLSTFQPGMPAVVISTAALLVVLGPWGFAMRGIALILAVSALLGGGDRPSAHEFQFDVLDVGQGTAAALLTHKSLTLYDAGPGHPGQWDLVGSTLLPHIASTGRSRPDNIVISHGDLDHAGGLPELMSRFPLARILANTRSGTQARSKCTTLDSWADGAAMFEVLHPSPFLPYLGNKSSCVISVSAMGVSILLPGDIGATVESRLVQDGLPRHDILLAPHHGSRTSSTGYFLDALQPEWVFIPAGAGNRFGFPHRETLERYRSRGIKAVSVSDCGALRLRIRRGEQPKIESARVRRGSVWRWPAPGHCP